MYLQSWPRSVVEGSSGKISFPTDKTVRDVVDMTENDKIVGKVALVFPMSVNFFSGVWPYDLFQKRKMRDGTKGKHKRSKVLSGEK